MKPVSRSVGVTAIVLSASLAACLAAMPANAATPQPVSSNPPSSVARDTAGTDKAGAPYTIKIGAGECPVIPKGSSISQNMQRLFETLTDACLMKASGVITDFQFESIRDQIVGNINMQVATDMAETSSPSITPLASNP